MPDQKISQLTAIVTVDNSADVLPIVDISANTTKKVTPTQLKTALALDNVNNTSDANKPVSIAQQDALNAKVSSNAAITAGTAPKITFDAKGLVTSGDSLDETDLPTGINANKIGTGVVSTTEFEYLNGVTSAIQTQIDSKQATLVSGTNIKTINSTSLLGSGDVAVQSTLVSGTNIKTINSTSLLGSGDITISANPSGVAGAIQFSNDSAFSSDASNLFWDDTNNRLGIGTNSPSATTHIKGSGSTSATTSLLVQNSAGTAALTITDDRNAIFSNNVNANSFRFSTVSELGGNCRVTTTNPTNPQERLFSAEGSASQTVAPTTSFQDIRNFTPTSGSALFTSFQYSGTINQTGGANGITRGLYINPTLTAAADFRAIEATQGNVLIGNTASNTAKLSIKGSGSTSATTSLLVQNSAGTAALTLKDDLSGIFTGIIDFQNNVSFRGANFTQSNLNMRFVVPGATKTFLINADYGDTNAPSAILEVQSTTKGFLPPRMTTTQKNAIATPASGLVVYDSTTNKLCCYNGSTWNDLF